MKRPLSLTDALLWTLCILCGISLQTQITLFSSQDYLGLRVNLTDVIAPFAGIVILYTLVKKNSDWPDWKIPHFYLWLMLLTAIFVGALLYGWTIYGELSRWALVNKVGGWFILLSIMGIGGWLARNATERQIETFLQVFLWLFLSVLIISTIYFTIIALNGTLSSYMAGLMANRNAFAFLFIAVLSISTCFYFSDHKLMPSIYCYVLYFFMPFFFISNGSRAGWICAGILLFALLIFQRRQIKKSVRLFLCAVLGTLCLHGIYIANAKDVAVLNPRVMGVFQGEAEQYSGDQIRIAVLEVTLPMIQEHPILGSGLGSIMLEQKHKNGEVINLLDNTALWLLAETGAIGLLAFTFFYFLIVARIFKDMDKAETFTKTLRQSVLFLIAGFTIMSLFHEFLYTRFLWFFLGLALALPSRMRQTE